jgi:hypothetical protein
MPTTMMVKNVRDNEMSVVERVFFDVVTAKGHGVASPYVTQPSTEPTAVRASTSSVLGRFDDDTVFRSSSGTIVKKNEGKGKGKMKGSKSAKKKNRVKEKKRKGDKPKGKKEHEVKKKHKVKKKKRK